jgi:hypothetical protein
MRHNATIESAALESARRELVQLREAHVERMTKKEAVRRLAKEIRAAKQGCSDEEIVEVLGKHGLAMSVATLKGYLRSGATGDKHDKKRAVSPRASAGASEPVAGRSVAPAVGSAGGAPGDSTGGPGVAAGHVEPGGSRSGGPKPRSP